MPDMNVQALDEDAVLKEVWNTDGIESKTELSSQQIESVNKLKTLSTIFGNEILDMHLKNFMILQKSKERKSMAEFVAVVKAKREDLMNKVRGVGNTMFG